MITKIYKKNIGRWNGLSEESRSSKICKVPKRCICSYNRCLSVKMKKG